VRKHLRERRAAVVLNSDLHFQYCGAVAARLEKLPIAKLPSGLAFPILRLMAALPIVRQFGELLLLTAQRPVRFHVEGEYRSGSRVAKSVYRSYMHKKNQEPSWGEEPV